MDTTRIRQLLKEGPVVLVEDGLPPLVIRELSEGEQPQEVPISARWPKGRSVLPAAQDQVLERLNKEILALKEQIAQEESGMRSE